MLKIMVTFVCINTAPKADEESNLLYTYSVAVLTCFSSYRF